LLFWLIGAAPIVSPMNSPREGFVEIRATYRLQFHRGFTFTDAQALVPYLAELGISHLYASPIMEARPGSTHGYDIINHNRINPEIGGERGFQDLVAELHAHGMGLILDIVPNHMGVGGRDNAWWLDVLEWGRESPFAAYFDINWDAERADLKDRILLPVLGDQYGVILEEGGIQLRFDAEEGSFSAWYFDHRFPISPKSYSVILDACGELLAEVAKDSAAVRGCGASTARERAALLKRRLIERATEPLAAAAIATALQDFNGRSGSAASFRRLHRLLDAQSYRLSYWRVAREEINYRRFFDINDLAGLRVELPQLFEDIHRRVFEMIENGAAQGLRIDHIDGLFDPAAYCATLQQRCAKPLYIAVEKILARYESLPDWPVAGTTGYDFANQALALFVDPEGQTAMTRLYRQITARIADFDDILQACKKRIIQVNLASEMNVLALRFHRLSMGEWRTRDFTLNGMLAALEEVISAFPVYRTYVSERGPSADDHRYIEWAIGQAKQRRRPGDTTILDFIHRVIAGDTTGHANSGEILQVAMHFQQVTGPVLAKACEDTAFYRYFRLLALNEVGGDPRQFGMSVGAFHHLMRDRARYWPRAMITTATHDTKRGEDARLRIALLSELPRDWGRRVARWLRFNRRHRSEIDGELVPDRNVEYLLYQTLVGVWPPGLDPHDAAAVSVLVERVEAYMIKAVREGKEVSSWSNPNPANEAGLQRFIRGMLDTSRSNPFLTDFQSFIELLAYPSAIASLSQLVLKLTVPGVPDIYQGGELWDFNLVDPDNRRPVDWERRFSLLHEIGAAGRITPSGDWREGRQKMLVMHRLLELRRQLPELFAVGDYEPLEVTGGPGGDHLCAFARRHGNYVLVIAVPRLAYRLYRGSSTANWGDAELVLPSHPAWRDVFTERDWVGQERVSVADLVADFPVSALLGAASP
jgi:(1->4)-alpha-D-glucan 1-alpha-D-glucosylmutase